MKASGKDFRDMIDACPETCIAFGGDAMTHLESLLLDSDCKSALVFLGGAASSERSGAWHGVLKVLSSLDVSIPRHAGIPPEPDVQCVEAMVKSLEAESPEMVIAAGGGSVMDAAKAAYLSWQSGMHVKELFGVGKASSKHPDKQFKRVACVPTTAGTGSEATPYANIVDRERGVKMLIMDDAIIPGCSFVDPSLTLSAPKSLTLSVALDALAHSVEGFLNVKATPKSPEADEWALESIRLIVEGLPAALANPHSLRAREMLSGAATLGGMVIRNKPTGLPHLCSYSLFDATPHGLAVAAFLPHFWSFYLAEDAVRERTMLLKGAFPGKAKSAEDVVAACAKFIGSCGGATALKSLEGCSRELLARIAKAAKENPVKLSGAPRPVKPEESEAVLSGVLDKAWEGKL